MPRVAVPERLRNPSAIKVAALLVGCIAAGIGVWALGAHGAYYANIGVLLMLSLTLAVSIRPILVGGEASFCHGAFYAIGAYAFAYLTTHTGVPIWLGLPFAGIVTALAAILIGSISLRASGATFFVMTFGFLVLVTALFQYATGITGGFDGISNIPSLSGGIDQVESFYVLTVVFALVVVLIFGIVDRSRWGLELRALGDSFSLAAAAGIGRSSNLLGAFTLGAFFAGVAGGFYASFISFVSPTSFSFWLSIYVLTYVMVGSARSVLGPIVGTAVIAALPLLSEWSPATSGLFVALVTLGILLVMPSGIVVAASDLGHRLFARRATADPPGGPDEGGGKEEPWRVKSPRHPESDPVEGVPLIRVEDVSKNYGGVAALSSVTLSVGRGEILGVIGPNGAGKTTLFNVMSGFTRPSGGRVEFEEEDITGIPGHRLVRRGLTRTFQASSVFGSLTVLDNILATGTAHEGHRIVRRALAPIRWDQGARGRAMDVLRRFHLEGSANRRAEDLPYGLRKMLGVAIAMSTRPQLLCLDEPLAGLSEDEADEMMDAVQGLRDRHRVTVIIVEHRIRALTRVVDRMVALDAGKLVAEGAPEAVLSNPEIVAAYLGGSTEIANA